MVANNSWAFAHGYSMPPFHATLFRILSNENRAFLFCPDMKKARFPPYTN